MAERAGRGAFVPVSLNLQDVGPAVSGYPFAGPGRAEREPEQPILLPEAPALVCESGVVVQANLAAARLAGRRLPESLIGLSLPDLVVDAGPDAELVGPDGRATPVRVARWNLPGTGLLVVILVDVSDLRSASDALRTERRRLAEVERVAGIGSGEFDRATGSIQWSPGHYDILGVEYGTVISGTDAALDTVHPQDRERVAESWDRHLQTGMPLDTEYRVLRRDGSTRTISARAELQHDPSGRPVRHIGCVRDVTEQRWLDRELAQERAWLLEAQRIARIGSFTWNWSTGELRHSALLAELFGAGRFDADLTDPFESVHPDDLPVLLGRVRKLVADPASPTVECRFRGMPEAGQRYYLCRLRAARSDDGEVQVLGTVQDVTEAQALERELREERRQLADAQRVARIGTWEWDPVTDRVVWSDMLQELCGVAESALSTYQDYLHVVHENDRTWVDELWRQLATDHEPVECEHRVRRPDGVVRVFHCYGAAIADVAGNVRLVGTAQDITEQLATQTRMERSSQRFTDLVAIAPVGIGIFDDGDRLVDGNDALCDLLGYDLETLRRMTFDTLTHPDEQAGGVDTYQDSYHVAGSRHYTVPQRILRRADGAAVYCELHVSVSVQDDGQRLRLVVFTDVTERRRIAATLKHQASHDELTGLPNRAAIKEMLTGLLAAPDRDLAVLFCDIDNFKRVNDSLGHDAGDELLVALARRLENELSECCTAGRLSGDVYVVICSAVTALGGVDALVTMVAGLLRTAVAVRGRLVRVAAAVGVAVPDVSTGGPGDLLRFADAALFQAKRQSSGQVALANAALMASADRQVELECELRAAIINDGLELYYQPVVGSDGMVHTAEALVRWPHPDRGLLPPEVFLPVAEQGDLMRELDRWVLRTALHQARDWVGTDGRAVAVAVNLSGLVPGEPDFVATVATTVAESGMPWDRVVLELVETAFVDLPCRTREAMAELVERGVRFAVDDFGTGYSSLARLKDLPAQIVKLDRRFVAGLGVDPADLAVARAVVDMATAMGRCCVAEGVETAAQFQALQRLGVDSYQGWLFSRAVGEHEFRALLGLGPLH
ncbi:MAG: EAL domain-containing protein [Pseudonocardiaceae bacterium]